MYKVKHKIFNLYLKKEGKIKRGKLASKGDIEYSTNSLKDIIDFFHSSNKGSFKNNLVIELIT